MADDAEHADVLQQFLSITGSDEGVALNVLENTDWRLEDAVRAADPVRMERLYEPMHGLPHGHHAGGGRGGGGAGGAGGPVPMGGRFGGHPGGPGAHMGAEPGYVDAFRDFEAEARRAGASGSGGGGAPAAGGAGAGAAGAAAAGGGLSDLFRPPEKILFKGPFEAAKAAANSQGRWLLVNIQGASEFASHRLNRDTWQEPLLQDMLTGMFVFWQAYDTTPQGAAAIRAYHLASLPAIFIIDPITGSKIWERTGFVAADTLVEELVPFMDAGPSDPAASRLAQQARLSACLLGSPFSEQRHAAAAASLAGKRKAAGPPAAPRTEDEELALALAMSVEMLAAGSFALVAE
ncbi:hypothetical protein MNEG_6688 [Monoraphidium neglectum]|uniref:UAS domain-containing protein n=1 Tax=Monoraphidium neglectum TaxID=145388 RepID=A0A0D2N5N7_9CHLO|nr:hypothetical protein MNEG_6688 [Monoraphidium neglectum]KIZ01271.1 hypothetical protein MNEG_6688 [Monoraphidium neglectum]|eukprot:XP_013900290.1 hypothetical protein MNEG_6688 [Monoraphidium neglectum]